MDPKVTSSSAVPETYEDFLRGDDDDRLMEREDREEADLIANPPRKPTGREPPPFLP